MSRRLLAPLALLALAAACGDDDASDDDALPADSDLQFPDAAPDGPIPAPDAAAPDAPPAAQGCGNGVLEPPEQCDDDNMMPGDGCTPTCQVEADCGSASLPLPLETVVAGDTTVTSNVGASAQCGGSQSGEQIYRLTVYETSEVTITTDLPGTAYDTALYLRRQCGQAATQITCAGSGPLGDTIVATLLPGTYFVYVDGVSGAEGAFEIRATATPVATIDEGQACAPDGSLGVCEPGTLCAPAPTPPPDDVCTPFAEACVPLAETPALPAMLSGSTVGRPDFLTSSCSPDGAAGEAWYAVDVPGGQRVDLVLRATPSSFQTDMFDAILSLTSACGSGTIQCRDSMGASSAETITRLDIAPGAYFVAVDGYQGAAGAFTLEIRLRPILGDGATCDPAGVLDRCDTGLACTMGTCQ